MLKQKKHRALCLPKKPLFSQYTHGASDVSKVSPDAWHHDQALLDRPGNDLIQLSLLHNYTSNVALYRPSTRQYTGLPETSYPFHDRTVNVTHCGRLCLHRKKINLSTSLAGQTVGIKEVEEAVWLVSFMRYDLGYIDLEEKTLQPIDNPFGTGVSPLS